VRRERVPGEDDDRPDLSSLDDEFAAAPRRERFAAVPDGKYEVLVEAVELVTSKQAGHPMLKWRLRILGPEHAGRLLWRHNVLVSGNGLVWAKSDLLACGIELERLSDLPDQLQRLLGLHLEVSKRTQGEYESIYINRRVPSPNGNSR
jgi:hypothetical protein